LSGKSTLTIQTDSLPLENPWCLALGLGFIAVFFSYGGYQQTIDLGTDLKDSPKNLPPAVISGMLIVISCYLLINIAYSRILGISGLASSRLVAAETARVVFGRLSRF